MLRKLSVLLFFFILATELFAQAIPYRIRMADSTYSAQLRGKSGTFTAGITINGSYSSTFKAHEFNVTVDGLYDLWFDPAGGTNYSKDTGWSGPYGKYIQTPYFNNRIDQNYNYYVDQIEDSIIALHHMTQAAIDYIGSGGNVTNNPDDVWLRTDSGNKITADDTVRNAVKRVSGDPSLSGLNRVGVYKHVVNNRIYNVLDYGAKGDGVTDDTEFIQQAIDSAYAGNGDCYLPSGTYIISPTDSNYCLIVKSNIRILGQGKGKTILKIADSAGGYKAIFSSDNDGADSLDYFVLSDMTVDYNENGNPATDKTELNSYYRYGIRMYNARNINIKDVEWKDITSTNTIVFNGSSNQLLRVINNDFINVGNSVNNFDHDHSTIYTNADYVTISNCKFFADTIAANGATTAIETHGSYYNIIGNQIYGYEIGMNITGIEANTSKGIIITNNIISGVAYGINIWSHQYVNDPHYNYGLDGLKIINNEIYIHQLGHSTLYGGRGIAFNTSSSLTELSVRNIVINHNSITYEDQLGVSTFYGEQSRAISWYSLDTMNVENFSISNNIIDLPPGNGIYIVGANLKNGKINDNLVTRPARSDTSAFWLKVPYFFSANNYWNVEINRNTVSDFEDSTRIKYGVYVTKMDTAENVSLDDFNCYINGTVQTGFTSEQYTTGVDLSGAIKKYASMAFSEQIADTLNGTVGGHWINDSDTTLWGWATNRVNGITVGLNGAYSGQFYILSTGVYYLDFRCSAVAIDDTTKVLTGISVNGDFKYNLSSYNFLYPNVENTLNWSGLYYATLGDTIKPWIVVYTNTDILFRSGHFTILGVD